LRKNGIEVNQLGKFLTISRSDDVMLRYDGGAVVMLRLNARYRKKVEGKRIDKTELKFISLELNQDKWL